LSSCGHRRLALRLGRLVALLVGRVGRGVGLELGERRAVVVVAVVEVEVGAGEVVP
jgi:hypothetical protein